MKSILILALAFWTACAPRDDLSPQEGTGGFNQQTTPIKISNEGEKLSTCSKDTDPTWDTIRLFNELQFIFNKLDQVSLIVGKGTRNCVKVSSIRPVELVIQKVANAMDFENSGAFYFVSAIEIVNTDDLLGNNPLMQELSKGMAMSVAELETFLRTDKRSQMTITYLQKSPASSQEGSVTSPPAENSPTGQIKIYREPEFTGKTASSCNNPWKDLRIFPDVFLLFKNSIEQKQMKMFLAQGDRNCYVIGENSFVSLKNDQGDFVIQENLEFKVTGVVIRPKVDFITDPILAEYTARDMGLSYQEFLDYLNTLKSDQVHGTWIQWVGE